MESPKRPPDTLLNSALRLLAARSRSVEEIRGRLLKKGFPAREVRGCVRWLQDRDLLDDDAYAESLVRERCRFSPRSPGKLRRELHQKGVSSRTAQEAIEKVLAEEDTSETRLSEEAARGWLRRQSPSTREALLERPFSAERDRARRRLYGFLARRGFVGSAARRGLEAAEEEARAPQD